MLAKTEPPIFEEQEWEPTPRESDLVNEESKVTINGRKYTQVLTTAKPGRQIYALVRLISPDGGREIYRVCTKKTRGRPVGYKPNGSNKED
jgi:hypothetical protein